MSKVLVVEDQPARAAMVRHHVGKPQVTRIPDDPDFERDYRQLVVHRLDNIEFFGATVAESSRHYPLSVAYLSLTVSGEVRQRRAESQRIHRSSEQPPAGAIPRAGTPSRATSAWTGCPTSGALAAASAPR